VTSHISIKKSKQQKNPFVSVVILNYKCADMTLKCLGFLKKQNYRNFETIVVENGSHDGSLEKFKKIKWIKLVESKKNLGYASGNNLGVKFCRGRYIALLNNDAYVQKNWLMSLVKEMELDNSLGCVMSKVYNKYYGKRFRFEGFGTTNLMGFSAIYIKKAGNSKIPVATFSPSGTSLLYRKSDVTIPFDDDYFAYYEDTYLGWVLRLKGKNIKIVPDSKVFHEGNGVLKNIKGLSTFFAYTGERNRLMNLFMFYSAWSIVKLLPQMLFSIIFLNLYDIKNSPSRIKSYLWLLFHINHIMKKRKAIQKQRKLQDSEILSYMSCKLFEERSIKNPLLKKLVWLINKINYFYCWIFFIRTMEFSKREENFMK